VPQQVTLVLSGGMALGAYQGGAYEALHEHVDFRPSWIAGTSIGAVNAALVAGNAGEHCVRALNAFWKKISAEPSPLWQTPLAAFRSARHAFNWGSVLASRTFGRPGVFQLCSPALPPETSLAFYDLAPLRETLVEAVDFDRLNSGDVRVTVATTDVENGELVLFDTRHGDRIGVDHLLASCGFLPDFAPVQIGGRLLGDGSLAANTPLEPVFSQPAETTHLCFVVDLFSAAGSKPASLEDAAARRWEMILGNQTRQKIRNLEREAEGKPGTVHLYYVAYRPEPDEAGPEKQFDFSRTILSRRWDAGYRDMLSALALAKSGPPRQGFSVHWM